MTETMFDHNRLDVYRLAMKFDGAFESQAEYRAGVDNEHEHRFAEHEQDSDAEPEPLDALCVLANETPVLVLVIERKLR